MSCHRLKFPDDSALVSLILNAEDQTSRAGTGLENFEWGRLDWGTNLEKGGTFGKQVNTLSVPGKCSHLLNSIPEFVSQTFYYKCEVYKQFEITLMTSSRLATDNVVQLFTRRPASVKSVLFI